MSGGGEGMKKQRFVIPYQTKMKLKRAAISVGIGLVVALLVLIFWLIWLQRFIVYTEDGVRFDFNRSTTNMEYTPTSPDTTPVETVAIRFNDGGNAQEEQPEGPFQGVYISTSQLIHDFDAIEAEAENLEPGTAVMLDVKSIYGNFYYSTRLSTDYASSIDQAAMDRLIATLSSKNVYLIARLPALRDTAYANAHTADGLPTQVGYLWVDNDQCYWLDPASESVLARLVQISLELKGLGFDEVVYYDFRFPESSNIAYDSEVSTDDLIAQAAQRLVDSCEAEDFRVSFATDGTAFPLPDGSARLYFTSVEAAQVQDTLSALAETLPDIFDRAAFFTEARDTRFDAYCVLRPLELD